MLKLNRIGLVTRDRTRPRFRGNSNSLVVSTGFALEMTDSR
ncbi:hypothetical protein [Aetokthonos hydrillicola]